MSAPGPSDHPHSDADGVKIAYISDNRTSSNWGCRATSIALAQVFGPERIVGTIYGTTKKTRLYPSLPIPQRLYRLLDSERMGSLLSRGLHHAIPRLARAVDVVQPDLARGSERLARYRDAWPEIGALVRTLDDGSDVVINGEGDMIFNRHRRTLRFLLTLIHYAATRGKRVYFINAMISPCPEEGEDAETVRMCTEALRLCTGVAVRDPESYRVARRLCPETDIRLVPDALFTWWRYWDEPAPIRIPVPDAIFPYPHDRLFGTLNLQEPYICVAGSSRLPSVDEGQAIAFYSTLVEELRTINRNVIVVQPCDGDRLLKTVAERTGAGFVPVETPILLGATVLANASVFVSGRYHPSILASLGGTPCVCMDSNSHKMQSLQELLGYDAPTHFPSVGDRATVAAIVQSAAQQVAAGDRLRARLRDRCRELAARAYTETHELIGTHPDADAPERRSRTRPDAKRVM